VLILLHFHQYFSVFSHYSREIIGGSGVLYCAVLPCAVLSCGMLNYTELFCSAVLCFAMLCVLCCVVLCCAVLCCAVLCCAVVWCGVLCCAVLRCGCGCDVVERNIHPTLVYIFDITPPYPYPLQRDFMAMTLWNC